MIKVTQELNNIFKALYESESIHAIQNHSFSEIMESNESRIDYLNHLFDKIAKDELSEECSIIFKESIDFLYNFMTGDYRRELTIPKKYFNDKEICSIIPTEEDLEYLFKLIEANKEMYEILYKNKKIIIELPKNSFNQNMIRELEIEEYNLAHLLGLTDSEPKPDPNKNALRKYFMKNIENTERYGDKISERLLNWILSEEGKNELRILNKNTIDFIYQDKQKNPNTYDSNDNIKPKALEKFKTRFKEATGLDFPIIKFSRYITKCINSLNFFNMNNIFQIILDYNAPEGKNDEKDIFIINSIPSLMSREIKVYVDLNNKIYDIMTEYANNDDIPKEKLKDILEEIGIDVDDKDIASLINLIQSYEFVEKHGINPNKNIALEKIRNIISNYFDKNIHLIGFDTEFDKQEVGIEDKTINKAHCDTSIALTVPELVGEYYERGRAFFLDKIYDEAGRLFRVSTPDEEMLYLEQMGFLEPNNFERLSKLKSKLSNFETKYQTYKNSLGNERKK